MVNNFAGYGKRQKQQREPHSWLRSMDTEGPFLSLPVLKKDKPEGYSLALKDDRKQNYAGLLAEFTRQWDLVFGSEDRDTFDLPSSFIEIRDEWVSFAFASLAEWGSELVGVETIAPLADQKVYSLSHDEAFSATHAIIRKGTVGAIVAVVPVAESLASAPGDGWSESYVQRMESLLQKSEHKIGLVTDGRWWSLVFKDGAKSGAYGITDAFTWGESPDVRDAFFALINPRKLVGTAQSAYLTQMFVDSVASAEEITERLGQQVRSAVELLVGSFSESKGEAEKLGKSDPFPADRDQVYQAAVTVMMRVVFLLFAEERNLLPQGEFYRSAYSILGQLESLKSRDGGDEALDSTFDTWHRVLSASEALYNGEAFDDARIPAYGGSLFDRERFCFLYAEVDGDLQVRVSDRVMKHVLSAVQTVTIGKEVRSLSFKDIDVEQIGYIYEGLLGYTCAEVPEGSSPVVGLIAPEKETGNEPEIPMDTLLNLYEPHENYVDVGKAVVDWVKTDGRGAKTVTANALAKALQKYDSDAGALKLRYAELVRVVGEENTDIADQLLEVAGVIRNDLRGLPYVIMPGGFLVKSTASRANAGAHYTPRFLAEEVVEHALEPLLFNPGPHKVESRDEWKLISSEQILELKVADIACGSGAFLVAAARFLAKHLAEAWVKEGAQSKITDDVERLALRQVIATCLYGADINEMAVEMCKLSLWLVSLDPKQPFSFVDDKILHGNSLLGITDLEQLRKLHIDPSRKKAGAGVQGQFDWFGSIDIDKTINSAITIRKSLSSPVNEDDPQRNTAQKKRQLREYNRIMADLNKIADAVIAIGLEIGGKPSRDLDNRYADLEIWVANAYNKGDSTTLDSIIDRGLTPTVETDYDRWKPLHWALAVPDVMERGGFDAIIGNPPFLGGQKITGAMGTNIREWLINCLAYGIQGSADFVAYFVLQAASLIAREGTLGLISTNTLAQGATREVALDTLAKDGVFLGAIQSEPWPSASAALEYAVVWYRKTSEGPVSVYWNGIKVQGKLSTLLELEGRVSGVPNNLQKAKGLAFQGIIVLGTGFMLDQSDAEAILRSSRSNAEVIHPFLNGQDLNSRPDLSASRFCIDFLEMTSDQARTYGDAWKHVEKSVYPERSAKDAVKYPRMVNEWWKFWNPRSEMKRAISNLDEALVLTRVSKTVMPVRVPTGQVFSDSLVVFATDSYAQQAILSSSAHQMWAIKYGSGMKNDPRYTPSDVFETFARPKETEWLHSIGRILDEERREIMIRRDLGLTKLYNLVNDPEYGDHDPDVNRMREIHTELDRAVMDAYGWTDIELNHGFHTYRKMTRWTVCDEARVEILDRLLEENHRRAAQEAETTPSSKRKSAATTKDVLF